MTPGQVVFSKMEEVVWGKPAAETVAGLTQKRGAERVFLMVSGTLNRSTDEIDKLRRALGNKCVGTFDRMPPHTPRSAVIAAAEQAREARAYLIVTLGGGSITDGAKAIQLCLANDIRTPEALKKTLQDTKSITYPQDGASRGAIEKMFERMGIAAEVKPRVILAPGSGPATESVAAGQAAMVITLFSEIVPTHGVEILGPRPGEYRMDIRFAAATSAASTSAEAGKALIAFLSGPAAAPVLKAKGIEPR